jgi:hypothetical protein
VYGHLVSEGAARELQDERIVAQWGRLVPFILNCAGDGQCPMETGSFHLRSRWL